MKNIKSYNQFQEENVQEGIKDYLLGGLATLGSMTISPEQVTGQTKAPTEMVTPSEVRKDIKGRVLTGPPSLKPEKTGKYSHINTVLLQKPGKSPLYTWSPQKHKEMLAKGYKVVWVDSSEASPKWGLTTKERKPPVVLQSDNDKFFELGGYNLSKNVKDTITGKIDKILSIDTIKIESSTDKTPLTKKLKDELESKGYTGDNDGLSKARSNSIKKFLISIGVDSSKIIEINLANQGKKGGYDPSARYVKLTIIQGGENTSDSEEYFVKSETLKVYYQKEHNRYQKLKRQSYGEGGGCEGGVCPTYD